MLQCCSYLTCMLGPLEIKFKKIMLRIGSFNPWASASPKTSAQFAMFGSLPTLIVFLSISQITSCSVLYEARVKIGRPTQIPGRPQTEPS